MRLIGDQVEAALKLIGVDKSAVVHLLGEDCGCSERKELLNQLDRWARRVISGRLESAKIFLENILSYKA